MNCPDLGIKDPKRASHNMTWKDRDAPHTGEGGSTVGRASLFPWKSNHLKLGCAIKHCNHCQGPLCIFKFTPTLCCDKVPSTDGNLLSLVRILDT